MKPKIAGNKDMLIYNSGSIVFFHLFDTTRDLDLCLDGELLKLASNSIDSQIFVLDSSELLKRYTLEGFDVKIRLYEDSTSPIIEGHFYVEACVFFNSTVSLSYRFKINQRESVSNGYTTDDLITIGGLLLENEHWNSSESPDSTSIDTDVHELVISNLHLTEEGKKSTNPIILSGKKEAFRNILIRYKLFINKEASSSILDDLKYVMFDVWEDIEHSANPSFMMLAEDKVIEHIFDHHKSELMGLLTLYPKEWIYRNPDSFEDICGSNIAIDTDDLVLCNENICIVIGTYGRRGGNECETDWKNHHSKVRNKYQVSWPEYLTIIELLLAQKQLLSKLHRSIFKTNLNKLSDLETISKMSLDVNHALINMNALRFSKYCSHRHMYRITAERLRIIDEYNELNRSSEYLENQINNLKKLKEKRESDRLAGLLAIISCLTVFQIFFYNPVIPIINDISGDLFLGKTFAYVINMVCAFLVLIGIFLSIRFVFNTIKNR